MLKIIRSTARVLVACTLLLILNSCSGVSGGLESFQSIDGRYAFLYPTGWTRVSVDNGPQVVFHDLINSDETLSLVVSKIESSTKIDQLGSPEVVGERLINNVIAPDGSGREAVLLNATERATKDHTYYDLEYTLTLANRQRHELATVVLDREYLYTLATSTNEGRWPKVEGLFRRVVDSFTFLI